MTVIEMSERELSRLRVLLDLSDKRLTVATAGTLMSVGRRRVYRLGRGFAAVGPAALDPRKRGQVSNHRHRETFQRAVLALEREHYPDFGPTLAAEKPSARLTDQVLYLKSGRAFRASFVPPGRTIFLSTTFSAVKGTTTYFVPKPRNPPTDSTA